MFYEITDETYKKAYKPYDIVTDFLGNVGYIEEVSLNHCQPKDHAQVSYSVQWLIGAESLKCAWYSHSELTRHCNLFVKIAESSRHDFTTNKKDLQKLLSFGI